MTRALEVAVLPAAPSPRMGPAPTEPLPVIDLRVQTPVATGSISPSAEESGH